MPVVTAPNSERGSQSSPAAHDILHTDVLGEKLTFYRCHSSKPSGNCLVFIVLQLHHHLFCDIKLFKLKQRTN